MARVDESKQTVRSALPGVEVADDEVLVLLVVVGSFTRDRTGADGLAATGSTRVPVSASGVELVSREPLWQMLPAVCAGVVVADAANGAELVPRESLPNFFSGVGPDVLDVHLLSSVVPPADEVSSVAGDSAGADGVGPNFLGAKQDDRRRGLCRPGVVLTETVASVSACALGLLPRC